MCPRLSEAEPEDVRDYHEQDDTIEDQILHQKIRNEKQNIRPMYRLGVRLLRLMRSYTYRGRRVVGGGARLE
jgi:hypothetical protein